MVDERDFEEQVAEELVTAAGPVRPVDDAAVFEAIRARETAPRFRPSAPRVLALASAGLIVVLVAGLLAALSATLPNDEQATPILAGGSAPIQAVEFSGRLAFGRCENPSSTTWQDRVTRTLEADNGRFCQPRIVEPFTDPRLRGEVFDWRNSDQHFKGPLIVNAGFSIHNEDGSWRQVPGVTIDFSDGSTSKGTFVLEGSGAYAGLLAIAEVGLERDEWIWRGWIIDGELPPVPAPPPGAR